MAQAVSKTDICNMALGFIGSRTVSSAAERTPEAAACLLYWDRARRASLRDFPWAFAQKRIMAAPVPLPEAYAGEWSHAYAEPPLCVKIHAVHAGHADTARKHPFRTVGGEAGSLILSRVDGAYMDYTQDVEETERWDELFIMTMARRLACLISVSLMKGEGRVQSLHALHAAELAEAEAQSASEERRGKTPDSWLEAARRPW